MTTTHTTACTHTPETPGCDLPACKGYPPADVAFIDTHEVDHLSAHPLTGNDPRLWASLMRSLHAQGVNVTDGKLLDLSVSPRDIHGFACKANGRDVLVLMWDGALTRRYRPRWAVAYVDGAIVKAGFDVHEYAKDHDFALHRSCWFEARRAAAADHLDEVLAPALAG
ncbi:hypothetical protein [Actinoplanes sp. URMC 104]|uniref:hypothetical protein n=1 Tax=Actinoplanes sp. URMC 104 TaxID=3423409 RepID=UPI003F1D7131